MNRLALGAALGAACGVLVALAGCAVVPVADYPVSASLLHHRSIAASTALTDALPGAFRDSVVGSFTVPGRLRGVIAITPSGCAVGTLIGHDAASVSSAFPTARADAVASVPLVFAGSKLGRVSMAGTHDASVSVVLYCGLNGVGVIVDEPATGLTVRGAARVTPSPGLAVETVVQVGG